MHLNFKEKTILVTAGSKGIGYELAKQFLILNANVCICSRNIKNLNKAKNSLLKFSNSNKLLVVKYDISKIKSQSSLIKKIRKKFSSNVDILINNSGGPPPKKIEDLNLNDWQKSINSNLLSAITLSKEVLKSMKKKRWGRIINLTSTVAREPAKNMVLSNVTRSGLSSFSKTLSIEIAKYGITVNTILTGGCETDRFLDLVKKSSKNKKDYFKNLKILADQSPMKKIAKPDEFVRLIIFLASSYSSYITGTAIAIDGGSSKSIF
tara:strand:+ start:731 stop:1525 length:795 start_codon:yes stop_codon:yes gene_type:complete